MNNSGRMEFRANRLRKLRSLLGSPLTPEWSAPLIDSLVSIGAGGSGDATFTRPSASTRINPSTGLLEELHGEYDQLIDTSAINPTSSDSWWSKANCSFDSDGGIIPTATYGQHRIGKLALFDDYSTYALSFKAKLSNTPGLTTRVDVIIDVTSEETSYFNLINGTVSLAHANHIASISAPDADGFYRCAIVFSSDVVTGNNALYIGGATNSSIMYTGNGTNPELYIKEINLVELPSLYVLGPEYGDDCSSDNTGDWSTTDCTLTFDTDHYEINYAAATQHVYKTIALEAGSSYLVSVAIKDGTASSVNTKIYFLGGTQSEEEIAATTTSAWATYTAAIHANTGNTILNIYSALSSGNIEVKNISVKKIPSALVSTLYGPELVVNGDFEDWTNDDPDGWEDTGIDENNYVTEVVGACRLVSDGTYVDIRQVDILSTNTLYLVTIDVLDVTSGAIDVIFYGGAASISSHISDTGSHSFIINSADNTKLSIKRSSSEGATDVTFTNVSIKEISSTIATPPYTATDTVPAEAPFEAHGYRHDGGAVINLLPYSENFDEWATSGTYPVTVTRDVTGPDGVIGSAYSMVDFTDAAGDRLLYTLYNSELLGAGRSFIGSIFLQGVGDSIGQPVTVILKRNSGTLGTAYVYSEHTLTSEWVRVETPVMVSLSDSYGVKLVLNNNGATGCTQINVFGGQITETPYLTPYVPTHGAPTMQAPAECSWTLTDRLKNILSDAVGDATSECTLVCEAIPSIRYGLVNSNESFLSLYSAVYSILYVNNSGYIKTYDGVTSPNGVAGFNGGDTLKIAITISASASERIIGFSKNGAAWSFGAAGTYDGAYTLGSALVVGYANTHPFHIKNIRFYPKALTTTQIEARF